jgi:cytochrome c oxidase cbb3-type subunit I/II
MIDPETMSPGSIMPPYPSLASKKLDISKTGAKIRVMQRLGVPYAEGFDKEANNDLISQAKDIAADLKKNNIEVAPDKEIIALIAYLQRLGTDIHKHSIVGKK